jgi:hypothetical protein
MFNGLPATTTPTYQLWNFNKPFAGTAINKIALTDDCAPFQYIITGSTNGNGINVYLPTNAPPGKSITFKCDLMSLTSQNIYFYDSTFNNQILFNIVSFGSVTFTCLPELTVSGFIPPQSSNWVVTNATAFAGYSNASNYGSVVSGYGNSTVGGSYSTVAGGQNNSAISVAATVGGGSGNQAIYSYSTVGGGYNNTAGSGYTTVGGGTTNQATQQYSSLLGGTTNTVSNFYGTLVGGYSNTNASYLGFIGGGYQNSGAASGAVTTITTTIAPGTSVNTLYLTGTNPAVLTGMYFNITAAALNIITSGSKTSSAIVIGTPAVMATSTISGTTLTVGSLTSGTIIAGMVLTGTGVTAGTYIVSGSGSSWVVSASQSVSSTTITGTAYTITFTNPVNPGANAVFNIYNIASTTVGGSNNQATGTYAFIGGGGDAGTATERNVASGQWSAVVGGAKNTASGNFGYIGGGYTNTANGPFDIIGSGYNNSINATNGYNIIAGGGSNTIATFVSFGVIGGGGSNSISTNASYQTIGGGSSNTTSNTYATVAGGQLNVASGTNSFIGGGFANAANGSYSVIPGGYQGTNRLVYGAFNYASGQFANKGDAQIGNYVYRLSNATGTIVYLTTDGTGTRSATNQAVISTNNYAYAFRMLIVGRNSTNNTDSASFQVTGMIANAGGTVSIVGTPVVTSIGATTGATSAGWAATGTITISADTTNKALSIGITQTTTDTLHWVARVDTIEVG